MSGGKLNPSRITEAYCICGSRLSAYMEYMCVSLSVLPQEGQSNVASSIETDKAISDYHYYCLFQSSFTSPLHFSCPSLSEEGEFFLFSQFKQSDNATSHAGQNSMWQDRQLVKPFQDDKRHQYVKH